MVDSLTVARGAHYFYPIRGTDRFHGTSVEPDAAGRGSWESVATVRS
jgi:hypothetical protein